MVTGTSLYRGITTARFASRMMEDQVIAALADERTSRFFKYPDLSFPVSGRYLIHRASRVAGIFEQSDRIITIRWRKLCLRDLQDMDRDPDLFKTYDFFTGLYDIPITGIPGFTEQIIEGPQFRRRFQLDRDDFRQVLASFLRCVTAAGDIEFGGVRGIHTPFLPDFSGSNEILHVFPLLVTCMSVPGNGEYGANNLPEDAKPAVVSHLCHPCGKAGRVDPVLSVPASAETFCSVKKI